MADAKVSRVQKEPTVVEPKPPVECNWKKGQVVAVSTLKKLFFVRDNYLFPEAGSIRITKITPDNSGRQYSVEGKMVGEKTIQFSWQQFWWERGPPNARKESFFYCALYSNYSKNLVTTKPTRKRRKSKKSS